MDCPACHTENATEAVTCAACGRELRTDANSASEAQPPSSRRRPNSRRRNLEAIESAALDSNNSTAWRAYRVALWALVPGLGLLLGPLAIVLGCLAVRRVGDDVSARNRAKAAVLFGVLVTLTQWLGAALIVHGW
jgi:hypothetical protein